MAKTVTKVALSMAKAIFENDRVRVVKLKVKKGDKIGEHTHGTYFAYAVTPFDYKSGHRGKT